MRTFRDLNLSLLWAVPKSGPFLIKNNFYSCTNFNKHTKLWKRADKIANVFLDKSFLGFSYGNTVLPIELNLIEENLVQKRVVNGRKYSRKTKEDDTVFMSTNLLMNFLLM